MHRSFSSLLFGALIIFAAIFVPLSSMSLPTIVASHFGASGEANGFMSRNDYLLFTLSFTVALPIALVSLTGMALSNSSQLNLPNREYWLAPERRLETLTFLRVHFIHFGSLLIAFLCFTHWQVLQANLQEPPRLASSWFIGGLMMFLLSTALWAGVLLIRFLDTPRL